MSPVAVTTPMPWPYTASVPEKPMHVRSPSGASFLAAAMSLTAGTDSPVNIASVICEVRGERGGRARARPRRNNSACLGGARFRR